MNNFFRPVHRPPGASWWWVVLVLAVLELSLPAAAPSPMTGLSGRSFAELLASAEKGDPIAQRLVANAYLTGEGAKQDLAEAVKWIQRAADQRDPVAEYTLGILYDAGQGVPRSLSEAVKWYERAAKQGLPDAQYNLGICYSKGEGVPLDLRTATEWFRRAAVQGDAQAQARYGLACLSGKGVERNVVEAVSWLRKAAYQEVPTAQFYLGRLYQEGEGVPQEFDTAVKWFRKSATQGLPDAQFALGRALLAGEGVERNQTEGRDWVEKSAAQRFEPAVQYLAQVARNSSSPAAPAASTSPAPKSPMAIAAARSATTDPPGSTAVPGSRSDVVNHSPSVPPGTLSTNAGFGVGFREPLTAPALPAVAPPAFTTVPPGAPKAVAPEPKDVSLPPFTPPAKEPSPTTGTPDIFTLPPAGKEAAAPPSFATEPSRARELEPVVRPREVAPVPAAQSAEGQSTGGLMFIAAISTGISALILVLGIYVAVVFKARLHGLEAELKKAQFELSKANVNLSAMMHQVEQLALMAPPEAAAAAKASLPEWNPDATKSHASSFKMHRPK